jgi:hypothetical protein
MGRRIRSRSFGVTIAAFISLAGLVATSSAFADTLPTGERALGQSLIEPAINDVSGGLTYLLTPGGVANPVSSSPQASAPLYLVVYPTSAMSSVGTLNCEDVPVENCPDHGPEIAGLAESVVPSVYGGGVAGHDHLVGIASSGGDFNVAWTVWVVLFTNPAAANDHLTTLSAINAAIQSGSAFIFPHAITTFHCNAVSAAAYNRGTPVG